jgi:hypothetical protein
MSEGDCEKPSWPFVQMLRNRYSGCSRTPSTKPAKYHEIHGSGTGVLISASHHATNWMNLEAADGHWRALMSRSAGILPDICPAFAVLGPLRNHKGSSQRPPKGWIHHCTKWCIKMWSTTKLAVYILSLMLSQAPFARNSTFRGSATSRRGPFQPWRIHTHRRSGF